MFSQTTKSKPAHFFPYAVVEKPLSSFAAGQVKYRGVYWKALIHDSYIQEIEAGEVVEVVGMKGISLLVVPFRQRV